MSNNYLKVGKLYSLTSVTDVSINGASFMLGINNNHNNAITVTVDGIAFNLSVNTTVNFPAPIAFSKVKISTGASAVIFYS
jgi:hypothetical protein